MLNVSDDDLPKLTEAQILTLMLAEYALGNPNENADKAFAAMLRCNASSISNWKSGKGSPGAINWLELELRTKSRLYDRWYKQKRKQFNLLNGATK